MENQLTLHDVIVKLLLNDKTLKISQLEKNDVIDTEQLPTLQQIVQEIEKAPYVFGIINEKVRLLQGVEETYSLYLNQLIDVTTRYFNLDTHINVDNNHGDQDFKQYVW